jgi:hypothetical protein
MVIRGRVLIMQDGQILQDEKIPWNVKPIEGGKP